MKKVKTNKLGKRILSFVLNVALMVGLMRGNILTVSAEGTDTIISDELIVESVSSNVASAICTCETDDPAFHATNCPAYIAPENPQCYCAEKCTEDTLNVWCDVCGIQGVSACQGEDTVIAYEILASGNCGAEGNESSVTWSLDSEGTLTISGTGAMADYELVLEYPYHYTTPWHDTDNDGKYQNSNIKKVVVEEGVTHIGNSAFKDFTELTSISISNTVKSIGNGSVSYCYKLTSLVIPDSVTSIGEEAFDQNIMLTSVTIGNSVESIGDYAFCRVGCDAGTNFTITLPTSVTYIAPHAFSSIYRGATIRYSCSYNEGNGYSTGNNTFYATLEKYHLCEYSSSGNEIYCSGCTCGEYSSSTATFSLSSDEPIYYTGEEIKPAVTVTYPDGWGGDEIEPSKNNCTYSFNINAGTATCTFKYAEGVEASLDFTIEKVDSVITAAPTPIADLEYDGTALNLINAGTTTDGEMQYSLDGTNYSRTIPTGTDAKTYTIWYKVDGDENHNDTEPASIKVSIAPKTLEIDCVTASDRAFDGTNTVEISEVIIEGILVEDEDKVSVSATATIDSIYIGEYSTVDLAGITLTGDAASNYSIAASAEDVCLVPYVTISKAAAPTLSRGSKEYVYNQSYEGELVSITGLPTDCGGVEYVLLSVSGDMLENISVDRSSGKITYDVKALDSYTEDLQGIIGINVEMENYETAFYTLTITRRDKYAVTVKDGMSVSLETNELIYGQRLGELAFNEVTFVGEAGEIVDGTLKWEDSNEVPDVATDKASWRFIPDSDAYKVVTGTLDITVHRAPLVVEAVPVVADRVYNPSVTLADVALSGGTVKDVYGKTIEGTWSWVNSDTVPTVGNAGYEAVFTPVDANYETVTGTFMVTVTKATPYVATKPTASALTYGQTLNQSVLSNGVIHYSETDSTVVAGSFAWEAGTVKPAVSDSETTLYNVLFTPDDSDNYKGVMVKLTVSVSKAEATALNNANKTYVYAESKNGESVSIEGLPEDCGSVSYEISSISDTNNMLENVSVDDTGKLTYDVKSLNAYSNGLSATVTVTVSMQNYEDLTYTLTVVRTDKLVQNISAEDITLTYGDADATISVTGAKTELSYEVVEDLNDNVYVVTVDANGKVSIENAGTAIIKITAVTSDTYAESECEIRVTVNKRPVNIKAESYTVKKGDTLPIFYYDVTGLVNNETLPITVSIACTASDTNTVGTYDITVSGVSSEGNYTYVYTNGVLEVLAEDEAPFIIGDDGKMGWDAISDEIEDDNKGDTIVVDMNGATVVPGDIIEEARDKDITVSFVLDNGLTWTIDGSTVTDGDISNINFDITVEDENNPLNNIPVDVINGVIGEKETIEVNLTYSGNFGFTAVLNANLGSDNAGYYANLYYYNPTTGKLEYVCADVIASNGEAELSFTHASDYLIVIDDEDLGKAPDDDADDDDGDDNDDDDDNTTEDKDDGKDEVADTGDDGTLYLWVLMLCALIGMAGVTYYEKLLGKKE